VSVVATVGESNEKIVKSVAKFMFITRARTQKIQLKIWWWLAGSFLFGHAAIESRYGKLF